MKNKMMNETNKELEMFRIDDEALDQVNGGELMTVCAVALLVAPFLGKPLAQFFGWLTR